MSHEIRQDMCHECEATYRGVDQVWLEAMMRCADEADEHAVGPQGHGGDVQVGGVDVHGGGPVLLAALDLGPDPEGGGEQGE